MKWLSGSLLLTGILFNSAACFSDPRNVESIRQSNSENTASSLTDKKIERRNEIESKMMRGEHLHDGALDLASLGDIDSIPALLVVLKEKPARPNGVMECTTAHALLTLKTLTGADPGSTHKAWSTWWENYKRKNPVSGRLGN